MTLAKKLAFALLSAAIVVGVLEGAARVVWAVLEARARDDRSKRGEEALRTDDIHFIKVPDGEFGYVLKPGYRSSNNFINPQGFSQRDTMPVPRQPGVLRVVSMGESTTMGHNVDVGNYPIYLKKRLEAAGLGVAGVEVINAGVAGWVSDQTALFAERRIAPFRPDLVIFYVGWNDFQAYDPLSPAPEHSYFETAYGATPIAIHRLGLRSVTLLSEAKIWLDKQRANGQVRPAPAPPQPTGSPDHTYRFFLASLDRMAGAYRALTPSPTLAICTLVGRWPSGTQEDFAVRLNGRTGWMKYHDLTPAQAADTLARFNELIKRYARDHGLILIDTAAVFAGLDRARLQWDFAHMHPEGYELLAEVIYEDLRQAGALKGAQSPRRDELLKKYALDSGRSS